MIQKTRLPCQGGSKEREFPNRRSLFLPDECKTFLTSLHRTMLLLLSRLNHRFAERGNLIFRKRARGETSARDDQAPFVLDRFE